MALPEGVRYQAGDYLAVLPLNPASVVGRALARFDLAYDAQVGISLGVAAQTLLPTDGLVAVGETVVEPVVLWLPATVGIQGGRGGATLQHRLPPALVLGCDAPDVDYLCRHEVQQWEALGVASVRPAFSEVANGDRQYVQDRLWQDRADVVDLVRRGAVFHVCGDGRHMAPAVHETCARIFEEATRVSTQEADAWLTDVQRTTSAHVLEVAGSGAGHAVGVINRRETGTRRGLSTGMAPSHRARPRGGAARRTAVAPAAPPTCASVRVHREPAHNLGSRPRSDAFPRAGRP